LLKNITINIGNEVRDSTKMLNGMVSPSPYTFIHWFVEIDVGSGEGTRMIRLEKREIS